MLYKPVSLKLGFTEQMSVAQTGQKPLTSRWVRYKFAILSLFIFPIEWSYFYTDYVLSLLNFIAVHFICHCWTQTFSEPKNVIKIERLGSGSRPVTQIRLGLLWRMFHGKHVSFFFWETTAGHYKVIISDDKIRNCSTESKNKHNYFNVRMYV